MAPMRHARQALVLALLVLMLPSTSGAQASGELAHDAPIALHGSGRALGAELYLHHHAFRDGSLEGRVFAGRLVERAAYTAVPDGNQGLPQECAQEFDGTPGERTVLSANGSKPWEQTQFAAAQGSMARLRFVEKLEFSLASLGDEEAAAHVFALVGPNPYAYEAQQDPAPGAVAEKNAPAFPTAPFVTVPTRGFNTLDPMRLEVFAGRLDTDQNGRAGRWNAGAGHEQRQVEGTGPIGTPETITCEVDYVRTYRLEGDTALTTVDQSGAERPQAFWDGAALGEAFEEGTRPPEGYWERARAAEFGAALEALRLPATVVAATQLRVGVEGTAHFANALGTVQVGPTLHQAKDEAVTLEGSFTLEPTATDDGRRMTTRVSDDVAAFRTGGTGDGSNLVKQYGPLATGAVLGAAALGGAYWAWPSLKFGAIKWALFPLYARLKREDILENALRDDILQVVDQSPGISASELGRRLECGWGTLVYHLTVLERMQLISSTREGRHKRFFVQGRINYSDKGAVGLLANASSRQILEAIRANPGIIQRDLSRSLNLSPGTVAWHVERLAEVGLIVREAEGRVVRYYPSQKLSELTRQLAA